MQPDFRPSVYLIADRARPEVRRMYTDVRRWVAEHADIACELDADQEPLPPDRGIDLAVVLGGDGTLLSQALRLIDRDLPLVGINFGRFGFLAEFDWPSLQEHTEVVFGGSPPERRRLMLEASVTDELGASVASGVALNDCVITAGEPYRLIELQLAIDDAAGPTLRGDGVIVASPVGSTAYNVSAGGPIVHPQLDAIVFTPLAAHSLAFRPIVISADCTLRVTVTEANPGTSLVLDGQTPISLEQDCCVQITSHARRARFVANPGTTYWRILQDKLRWAVPPSYREERSD